jgi:hypothetical protein
MSDQAPTSQSKVLQIRPLTKGMFRAKSTQLIEQGAFYTLENYLSTDQGIKNRGGYTVYGELSATDYPPIQDMFNMWFTTGQKETFIFDSKFLYSVGSGSFTRIEYAYSTGTIAVSGTTVTGSGTTWNDANYIYEGDVIVLDANGSGDGPEEVVISTVGGTTSLTLASTPTGTYGAGTDYKIVRAFYLEEYQNIDFDTFTNALYFTDSYHPLYKYDGSSISLIASGAYICRCCCYFGGRLWAGNIYDVSGGTTHKQMIRWSSVGAEDLDNYLNLPYMSDELLRIIPLGNYLILYFENSIWMGRPTNIAGDNLPYAFEQIPTNDVGLIGMKAVTQFTDAHVFVGQDDVYVLGINGSLQRIGSQVFDDMLSGTTYYHNIYVSSDLNNKNVVIGIPNDTGSQFEKIWRYNYTTNAWSYDVYPGTFLSNNNLTTIVTIDDLSGNIEDLVGTIDSLSGTRIGMSLWTGKSGYLVQFANESLLDEETNVVRATFITGDIDLDSMETDKTWMDCTIKLRDNYIQDDATMDSVHIRMYVSGDKGATWKDLGEVVIREGYNECRLNYQFTANSVRFKGVLTSDGSTNTYTIEEMTFRVKGRGISYYG